MSDFRRALELIPACPEFLVARGTTLEYFGKYAEAIEDYEAAVRIDPRTGQALYNLAFLRAACPDENFRNAQQALKQAQVAQPLPTIPSELKLEMLAAAYAESGDFENAIENQSEALNLTSGEGYKSAKERLELYRKGKPYHREPEWWR